MKKVNLILAMFAMLSFYSCKPKSQQQTSNENEKIVEQKKWVVIDSLIGSGIKQSKSFHLTGGDVTLSYAYQSDNDQIGMFGAYVLEKGVDLNKDGGFPDIMTNKIKENSTTEITRSKGDYYLKVSASGDYKILVSELK